MTDSRELFLNPLIDYTTFFEQQLFCDCELSVNVDNNDSNNNVTIYAHRLILANASDYFLNIFTGDAWEAKMGKATIHAPNPELFSKVISFMYNGKISFEENDIMQLYAIANEFSIPMLKEALTKHIKSKVNSQFLLNLVDQCFQAQLLESLRFLEDDLATSFTQITTENFSKYLDVVTYAHILQKQTQLTDVQKFVNLSAFIGNFQCDDVEKAACAEVFTNKADGHLRQKLKDDGIPHWLPSDF